MDDLTMWSLVVGFGLPLVISAVQQPEWPDWLRSIVTAAVCLVVGGGTAYLNGDLTTRTWVSAALVVLVTALTTYRNFWKQTGVAQRVEAATSPGAEVIEGKVVR